MRFFTAPGRVAAVLIVLMLLGGCTSGSDGEPGAGSLASDRNEGAGKGGANGNGKDDGTVSGSSNPGAVEEVGTAIDVSGAREVATLADPADDAITDGELPDDYEIIEGSVADLGDRVALTLELSSDVPEVMPDDTTFMIVSWNLAGNKLKQAGGFTAQATAEGWQVAAAVGNEPADYPGELSIEGNRITLAFPWSFIAGRHALEWSAAAQWIHSTEEAAASSADNITEGRFPSKKKGKNN